MQQHILPIRVYYDETDIGGIVHHSHYLRFCERGRTESLRALGFDLVNLAKNYDTQFAVRRAELEYLQSARLDQLLYVITEVREVRGASILYNQRICLDSIEGPVLCTVNIRLACLDGQLKPKRLPEVLMREIKK